MCLVCDHRVSLDDFSILVNSCNNHQCHCTALSCSFDSPVTTLYSMLLILELFHLQCA